jgi:hypothetical protein
MCRLANFWGTAALLEQDGKRNSHSGGTEMLRQTLITLTAVAALGIGSTAVAAHSGGGGGGGHGGGGGGWGGGGHGGGFGGGGGFAGARSFGGGGSFAGGGWRGGNAGPMMMRGGSVGPVTRGTMTAAPVRGPVQGWNGPRNNFAMRDHHFHDHFHNRFRNRNFFAFGFGGPFYDYAYDSCWIYYGWQWVNVCGGYGY